LGKKKKSSKQLAVFWAILPIFFLYFIAFFADFIAPYSPNKAFNPRISYSTPVSLRFSLRDNLYFYFHPRKIKINRTKLNREFLEEQKVFCKLAFFQEAEEYKFLGLFKTNLHLLGVESKEELCQNSFNLLGTDNLGRDLFSRLLFSLRPSLYAAILGILFSFPVGVFYGAFAGWQNKELSELMMRIVEVILSLPSFYLLVILAGLLPANIDNKQRFFMITIILSLISWAALSRVVRNQVLSVKKKEFVEISQTIGKPDWKILIQDIIPQLSSYLIITITISFPGYILGETALSFLGLGINQPDPSLGNILFEGKKISNLFLRPWIIFLPGFVLVTLTWSCHNLGDKLRDLFDVKVT